VERVVLLGNAGQADLLALGITVLLDVLLSTLEDDLALLLVGLLLVLDGGGALSAGLLLRLALLQEGLGDQDVVLGGDGTVGTRLVRSPAYH
jgi:hypothetical protein